MQHTNVHLLLLILARGSTSPLPQATPREYSNNLPVSKQELYMLTKQGNYHCHYNTW